ncbi:MAG TPA: ISL3 family transposase [Candidatus Aerophobetes bacterium]|uniref:ISL3 family transposase n=1 Tax=Aerophobetes bacterium TaxID=2030807 RepID=A0A662DDX0_UNCAE|nr:MAG: ISL3 family transposase [Candidatus Aerophobetes bacterium]HDN84985.1 ISL3 family transposase [Candidatus Aerophobetes bacterium]
MGTHPKQFRRRRAPMQKQIQKLLNIDDNFTIKDIKVQGEESIIFCEWKRSSYVCPECGEKVKNVHQYHGRRKVLHEIKSDRKRVYISYPNIRLKCTKCSKIFTLRSKSIFPWLRVTSFMLLSILDRLRSSSFKQVANLSGISPTTLRKYARVLLKNELDWKTFEKQEKMRLGIDEHSISGRKKMALLIVELLSSTPIAVLYTHKKEELVRFLDKIPPYAKRKIDEVVIDLNQGYKNAIRKALPHVRIVADPFHVVRDANKRVDDERKVAEEVYFALNGKRKKIPKRCLMQGKERLRGRKKQKVKEILSQHENIRVFYHFKEKVRSLYKAKNYKEAEKILESIIEEMRSYKRWPALRRWQKSLERWHDEILNHFISKSSNGKVEGYNVVVKLLKRISFGMRNPELYAKKIMLGLVPMRFSPQVLT